jgi:hypothetical protein
MSTEAGTPLDDWTLEHNLIIGPKFSQQMVEAERAIEKKQPHERIQVFIHFFIYH